MKLSGFTHSAKNISPSNLAVGMLLLTAGATVAKAGVSVFLYGAGFRGKVYIKR